MKAIRTLNKLAQKIGLTEAKKRELEPVIDQFSMAIPAAFLDQRDLSLQINDPVARQFIPQVDELKVDDRELDDPVGDGAHTAVKGVVHRYPDRCLLMPLQACPVYCRFCFRREQVGDHSKLLTEAELEAAYDYIGSQPGLWEVILTGGDPLFLKPAKLQEIISRLSAIEHIKVLRIHTRVPVLMPDRINSDLIKALKQKLPVYIGIHANHPKEFTAGARSSCQLLAEAGIPLLGQTVLLKGVNDEVDTLTQLMRCFVENRIKPYYLHHLDWAKGTGHFRVPLSRGRSLVKALRGRISGICQPTYVIDIPGGYGKSPVGPDYLFLEGTHHPNRYWIEDYLGDRHLYEDS